MIANTAIFTCSICGEASSNICAYCTKDACSNHRCERCKRCSDCCECEFPLSAEEPAPPEVEVPAEAALEPVPETATGAALAPEGQAAVAIGEVLLVAEALAATETSIEAAEASDVKAAGASASIADFLTPAEASVFVVETVPSEPALPQATSVFIEETDTIEETGSDNVDSVAAPESGIAPDANNLHEPSGPEDHSPST